MKVLIIDGYNMIHRCRFNWGGGTAFGEHQITYNFFRTIRSTINEFSPDVAFFALEGHPKHRLALDSSYKANRIKTGLTDEEIEYWDSFHSQKREIISLIKNNFPVVAIRHSDYEADDVIYELAKYYKDNDTTVISSDTDFIQLLNDFENVSLWNPLSKSFRENTEYDYVSWKAMVGDKSDNIPGVSRIGKKTATKILRTPGELSKRLEDISFKDAYEVSYALIKLSDISDFENAISTSHPANQWETVRKDFIDMEFAFAGNDEKWSIFCKSFNNLWSKIDLNNFV